MKLLLLLGLGLGGHDEVCVVVLLNLLAKLRDAFLGQVVLRGELLGEGVNVGIGVHLNHFLSAANVNSHVQAFYLACPCRRPAMHFRGRLVWRETTSSNLQVLRLIVVVMLHFVVVLARRHLVSQGAELVLVHVVEFVLETTAQACPSFLAHGRLYRVLSALVVYFVDLRGESHLMLVPVELNFISFAVGSGLLSSGLMI